MNKEKALKILLLSFIAVATILFFVAEIFFKQFLLFLFCGFLFTALVLLILEVYLRIQHNIDKKFTDFSIDETKKIAAGNFLVRSSIEFKFLNLKYEIEKNLGKVIDEIKENGSDIKKYLDEIKINGENAKKVIDEIKENGSDIKARLDEIKINEEAFKIYLDEIKEYELDAKRYLGEIKTNGENAKKNIDEIKESGHKTHEALNLIRCLSDIYTTEEQKKSVLKLAPDAFSHKTALYVGANPWRLLFLEEFFKNDCKTTILEIFKQNIDYLKNCEYIAEVIEGDIRTFNFGKKFDVVFWWHGPEHIEESQLPQTLKKLESLANNLVVLGCPWGKYEQGAIYGNIYETHLSEYYEGDFEKLGYKVDYFGRRNVSDSNICAIKYVN